MGTDSTRGSWRKKALRIVLAVLLALVALPALPPTRALAASPPASISGTFYLTRVSSDAVRHFGRVEINGGYAVAYFSGVLMCTSSSAHNTWDGTGSHNPGPTADWGTFTAKWDHNDEAARLAYYYIGNEAVLPHGQSHWGSIQNLGRGFVAIPWDFTEGHVSLAKTSAKPDVTDGNPFYSLAGAEYGVYTQSGSQVGTIVTDASGRGSLSRGLTLGWYCLKELKAPPGYLLDREEHWVELTESNQDATVTVADMPISDPQIIRLQKIDGAVEIFKVSTAPFDAVKTREKKSIPVEKSSCGFLKKT